MNLCDNYSENLEREYLIQMLTSWIESASLTQLRQLNQNINRGEHDEKSR